MGCLFVLVLAAVTAAMTYFFGYLPWVLIVLGSLWLPALAVSAIFGHRGFGGRGNTDFMIVLAGMFVSAAIIIPRYSAKIPCTLHVPPCAQATSALTQDSAKGGLQEDDKTQPEKQPPENGRPKQPRKICPRSRYIDCMPPVKEESRKMCSKEYLDWIKKHCPDVEVVY